MNSSSVHVSMPELTPSQKSPRLARRSAWFSTLLMAGIVLSVLQGIWPVLMEGAGFLMKWLFAASGLFVLLGSTGRWDHLRYRLPFRTGLLACAAGDLLGPGNFQLGVGCFLVAHLAFAVGCLGHGVQVRRLLIWGPLVAATSFGLVGLWLWPHVPERDRPLIVAYTAVISVMLLLASALRPSPIRSWLLVGAWIFYLSDIFVARWRFVDPSSANGLVCYPLYYLACTLLASATGQDLSPPNAPTPAADPVGKSP